MSEVDNPASDSPASNSSAGWPTGGLHVGGLTCEGQCGCGYFPRARYNPGNRPFGTNHYFNCINVCTLGLSALSGDVPLYVWM